MPDKFFISDTHFFHQNILTFKDSSGSLIRGSRFKSVEEMNDTIVENWNRVVRPQDKVYHLGDVFCGVRNPSQATELIGRLNGHLALYLGNHDHIDQPAYRRFRYVELWSGGRFKPQNFVCSHIPLRQDQMRDGEFNVHGHIHQNLVRFYPPGQCPCPDGCNGCEQPEYDPHYINVCVEQTNYTPVSMDEIIARIKSCS